MRPTINQIYQWLEEVKDPEIPVLSLVDLGVITLVSVEGEKVTVEMTPTFVGCPALDFMQEEIRTVLRKNGIENVQLLVSFREPWSSEKISEKGKRALQAFGISPPSQLIEDLEVIETAACPRCQGTNTELKNAFGPTLCRAIHYCHDCHEAFEQFKPL
jgi:ring-1,2-phenylacetyl-CoA epoxidase subunit PaaD